MTPTALRWIGLLATCALIPGCLLNSVRPITSTPRLKPDATHAIVVIGMGLEATWPYREIQLTFAEYSAEKQSITGNCFHYNRIEATRRASPAKINYLAFEVPANTYVYLNLADTVLVPSSTDTAFRARPGSIVYFGDYVFVGNKTMEFRRDLGAARVDAKKLLPRGAVLELAESTTPSNVHLFLCTP